MISSFVPIILASGVVSFITTPLVRRLAQRVNFVAYPAARKLHITPMPMLGGVAIYLGLLAAVVVGGVRAYAELLGVIGGATVMTLFGLWDDRADLKPPVKLLGQALAAACVVAAGMQIRLFDSQVINISLTILWIIGIANAINFQDNMDGLAAGLATVTSGFFLVLAITEDLGLVATLAAATVGASIGFLYYNFNPASLFMGDAGSLLLGFMLAVLGLKLEFAGQPQAATWIIPVAILGVPIFDTALVVISRLRRGKHVYEGGKDHTSHRLVSILGMTHARAVMTLYMISGVLGLIAIILRDANLLTARLIIAGLIATFVGALIWLEVRFDGSQPPQPDPPAE